MSLNNKIRIQELEASPRDQYLTSHVYIVRLKKKKNDLLLANSIISWFQIKEREFLLMDVLTGSFKNGNLIWKVFHASLKM